MTGEEIAHAVEDKEIDLFTLFTLLWRRKWLLLGVSIAAGIIVLFITLFMPDIYRAEAVIKPVEPEENDNPFTSKLGDLVPVLEIGSAGSVEDLEVLLKSRDLTVRVFDKYQLYPKIFSEEYDSKTGEYTGNHSIISSIKKIFSSAGHKAPGAWDAIRAARKKLVVKANVIKGIVTLSFEAREAELSSAIVDFYLEEAKSRLQEQSLERAQKNKEFLEEQLKTSVDPLIKERLYYLYAKEVEKEMLAKNREQFAFTIIDPPKVPDKKYKPKRLTASSITMIITLIITSFIVAISDMRKKI